MNKWVYSFGSGSSDGNSKLRDLLGGKGANLAEMDNIGQVSPLLQKFVIISITINKIILRN